MINQGSQILKGSEYDNFRDIIVKLILGGINMDYNQKKIEGTSDGKQDKDIENTSDEKLDKFKEIGARRVAAACKAIQLIGNLSNKGAYHYEEKHLQQIFAALDKEVVDMKAKFQPDKEEKSSFSFNE